MSNEKIGRYEIKSELGRGGMATVFHAYDPSFERDVAVKVLPRAFLHDKQFRARFTREAKTVAALEHSAIVPVYDFGEEDGQPYIVMRMMSGGSLEDKLNNGKLSVKEATDIIARLTSALEAAHSQGIIHRDLKPGNILFDQYDNAFLSDFGIARLAEATQTLTGENIIGTPAYMSPEQVQGDKDLDGRSDLYSLGIIFYQMLTMDTPYQATTPAKVMMMHLLEPVPNLAKVKPDLIPEVNVWLQKALAKEPGERFATAKEMSEALQAAVKGSSHPTLSAPKQTVVSTADETQESGPPPIAAPYQSPGPQPEVQPAPASYPSVEEKPKRSWLPFAAGGFILLGIGAVVILVVAFLGYQDRGPLAMLAGPTATTVSSVISPSPEVNSTATSAEVVVNEDESTPTPTEVQETLRPPAAQNQLLPAHQKDYPWAEPTKSPSFKITTSG